METNLVKLLSVLTPQYKKWIIDNEDVVYRRMGDYEVEISGLDNRRKNLRAYIYIWYFPQRRMVDERGPFADFKSLIAALVELENKYQS